jgi:hypothetical protein
MKTVAFAMERLLWKEEGWHVVHVEGLISI